MENIKDIVKNHLSKGVVLMDLVHNSKTDFIKIIIDSPFDIPISETSKLANRIKNDESILSMFPNGCRLEVGTPGIGTDLVEKFQYEKNVGREISLKFYNVDSNLVSGIFPIVDVEDNGVIVSKSEKDYLIMFENIISAKIIVSFD
tara:strand:- start:399 stop:836 length:438 start_codon:yes stop_codon:yes gene_type:complete